MDRFRIHGKTLCGISLVFTRSRVVTDIVVQISPTSDDIKIFQCDPQRIHLSMATIATHTLTVGIDRLFDRLRFRGWTERRNLKVLRGLQGVTVKTFQDPCPPIKRIGVFPVVRRHQHDASLRQEASAVPIFLPQHHLGKFRCNLLWLVVDGRYLTRPGSRARLGHRVPFNSVDVVQLRGKHHKIRVNKVRQTQIA